MAYSVRGRAKNSRGNSNYSDIIVATPRSIPTAPSNVQVNAVSGECLEVSLVSPVYGEPFISYTAQWDYDPLFSNAQDDLLASCSSNRYGSCVVPIGVSPCTHVDCLNQNHITFGYRSQTMFPQLSVGTRYYIKLASINCWHWDRYNGSFYLTIRAIISPCCRSFINPNSQWTPHNRSNYILDTAIFWWGVPNCWLCGRVVDQEQTPWNSDCTASIQNSTIWHDIYSQFQSISHPEKGDFQSSMGFPSWSCAKRTFKSWMGRI